MAIISKWNNFNTSKNPALQADSFALWLFNNAGTLRVNALVNPVSGSERSIQVGTIPLYTWTHIAMTYNGSTGLLAVYVNGALAGTQSGTPSNLVASVCPVNFARDFNTNARNFVGLIDEAEIFDHALSPTEIADLYNANSAGKCHLSTLQFSSPTYSVSESGTNATITATRTGTHDTPAAVSYATIRVAPRPRRATTPRAAVR